MPPPPGVIRSLKAGFDAIASHITTILLPIALDAILWLGPHFSLERLFQPLIISLTAYTNNSRFSIVDIKTAQGMYTQFFQQFNLLSLVRTFPIGISSLMSGWMPTQTPFGTPAIIQVPTFFNLFGWLSILTVVGWIGGGMYFYWISNVISDKDQSVPGTTAQSILQVVLLSTVWMMLFFILGFPSLLFFTLLFTIGPLLAQAVLFLLAMFALWLIVPIFFSPHGIFIKQQKAFRSILSSIQVVRFTAPTSSLFVLSVFIISQGLNLLWTVPRETSWLTLVGIAGHAFITTALLAASFIYYRDMIVWLQIIFEQSRAQVTPKQI